MGKRKLKKRKDAGSTNVVVPALDRERQRNLLERTAGRRGLGFVRRPRAR